ncbi:hypothetical protein G6F50_013581 [Rhizopus delemar]|uniref:Uncharacterized protein n=1 Tax=Rhizopus delemar TaxID=936053 RepID=A0A9P7CD99_9FUNG|nr:hypothetical protein G6F50_013581 [Rhizopus delemar]
MPPLPSGRTVNRHDPGFHFPTAAGQAARSALRRQLAAAGLCHRSQRRHGPARGAGYRADPAARRYRAGPQRPGHPHRRSEPVRGDPAAFGAGPPPRHRARQRYRPDRRRLPGAAADQRLEPWPRGLHHRAGRSHRSAGGGADCPRQPAGGGYFHRQRAGNGWIRPYRGALTGDIDERHRGRTAGTVVGTQRATTGGAAGPAGRLVRMERGAAMAAGGQRPGAGTRA